MQQFITADRRWEYTMRTPFSDGSRGTRNHQGGGTKSLFLLPTKTLPNISKKITKSEP